MTKKLLLLLLLVCSLNGFGQASAYPPPNLEQCNNEVFNLTAQTPVILGNQPQPQFTVTYFQTQTDAVDNTNPIANPNVFVGVSQTIFARVDNTADESFAITSFQIAWSSLGLEPAADVMVCESYSLPALNVWPESATANYYTEANGGGILLLPGTVITTSQTIFIHAANGDCVADDSFEVTVADIPPIDSFSDVTACDSFVLPTLQVGSYYTGPGGTGSPINAGDVITSSMTVYVFASNGLCWNEQSFTVTIISSPIAALPPRVNACESYELPELPANFNYFTGPYGTGAEMNPGDVISESAEIHVYAASQTIPNCTADYPLSIEIGMPQIAPPLTYPVFDCDGDGLSSFDLTSLIPEMLNGLSNVDITFYESLADAELGINAVNPIGYSNIIPFNFILYARGQNTLGDCFTIVEISMAVEPCAGILGVVRLDADQNGCSETDLPAAGIDVVCTHDNDIFHAYTNAQGEYEFTNVPQGINIVYVPGGAQLAYGTASPTAHTFNIAGTGINVQDFCITPAASVNDAAVSLMSSGNARPGMAAYYWITVQNLGNTVLAGTVTLNYDSALETFNTAMPMPVSTMPDTLTFAFSELQPYEVITYSLSFLVMAPPTVNAGTILNYSAAVSTTQSDDNLGNDQSEISQIVVNSYDPNDIAVSPGAYITQSQVPDDLIYTVRFQNSGSADAVDVRIENTLDPNLDWSTFRLVVASHEFAAEREGNQVVFRFDNINLPAESANEPESHGFITYRIKPVQSLALGDVIENQAAIYFDFNAPITTNTVTTQLVLLGNSEFDSNAFELYPNPASGQVAIRFADAVNAATIDLTDIQGKLILSQTVQAQSGVSLDISKLQGGLYFIKVVADGKSGVTKLIVN